MRWSLAPGVRVWEDDRVLAGGSPLTVMRLSERGWLALGELLGEPDPAISRSAGRLVRRLEAAGLLVASPDRRSASAPEIDVVVPVLCTDDGSTLRRCLAAIRHGAGEGCRVVVVDDASPDDEVVAAVGSEFDAVVVRHSTNRGPAAARNTGWRRCAAPVVAFVDVDVDTSVDPSWWAVVTAAAADGAAAPRVVSSGRFESVRGPLDMGDVGGRVRPMSRVAYVPSAAMVVRRDALEAVGGFDEALRFGEDVDLVWRLDDAGFVVRYVPEVTVAHPPATPLRRWVSRRVGYGSSVADLHERHPGRVAPVVAGGWTAAAWAALIAGSPAAAVAAVGVAGVRVGRAVPLSPGPRRWWRGVSLAAAGTLQSGRALGRALVRPWWPATLVAVSVLGRRPRRLAALAVGAGLVAPPGRRVSWSPAVWFWQLVDDVAYGWGAWSSCVRRRNVGALVPRHSIGSRN